MKSNLFQHASTTTAAAAAEDKNKDERRREQQAQGESRNRNVGGSEAERQQHHVQPNQQGRVLSRPFGNILRLCCPCCSFSGGGAGRAPATMIIMAILLVICVLVLVIVRSSLLIRMRLWFHVRLTSFIVDHGEEEARIGIINMMTTFFAPPSTTITLLVRTGKDDEEVVVQQQQADDESDHFPHDNSRGLEAESGCVLSEPTPFVFHLLVELSSPQDACIGTAAATDGTLNVLGENDEEEIKNAILTTFTLLAERYCDPYFRKVSSVEIVRQGISPSAQSSPSSSSSSPQQSGGSSLTLEIQVMGTLRCEESEESCNIDKIGLFDLPQGQQQQQQQQQQQEPTCLCLASNTTTNNTTSAVVSNRGPTESEFMEKFGLLLDVLGPSLECSDLQVANCAFGTVFQSAIVITFADPEAARNATTRIQSEALRTLNDLTAPDDPNVCYPEFRVFQSVNVVFQEARRQLQQTGDGNADGTPFPSTLSPANASEELLNVTVAPSQSPTPLFDAAPTAPQLTAVLYVNGFCSECGSEIFLNNDVSARRRRHLGASFQDAMENRQSRNLQAITNITATSNCFCPIDSIIVEGGHLPAIEQFKTTLEERVQLEITEIQEVDPNDIFVDGNMGNGTYRYPCTDVVSTFKKNVTLELQVRCGSAALSDDDKNWINLAYASAYNGLRSTVCDPFNLEVTSANVVETGALMADGISLPLLVEVTVDCLGCDPLDTNVYGFPQSLILEQATTGSEGVTRRFLYEEEGTCTCNSTLPRRAPSEAEVTDALSVYISQRDEDVGLTSCIGNVTTCDFGTSFASSALLEVAVNSSIAAVDPQEIANILQIAFTNALNRLVGGGNSTTCNPLFGLVTDTAVFLDFVYNSVESRANETAARRQLQDVTTEAPAASNSTFIFSWDVPLPNISNAPTAAPSTRADDDTEVFLLSSTGLCNGCPTELIFSDAASGRRRMDQISSIAKDLVRTPMAGLRFLEDITGAKPESDCYCPIGSVEIPTDFQQISLLEVIQEEIAKLNSTITVIGAESGMTKVECAEETSFSTTIDFAFSAFEWVVDNEDDVQGLGDAIASVYNELVGNFCDEYFRNSISLTYVTGSLQRVAVTGQRHYRDLQNTQGCFNYHAAFNVAGLCRGCQALGTPIPLFGNSTVNRRLLEDIANSPHLSRYPRRLQEETGSTCICDSKSISQRSAPSLGAIRAGLEALIPDPLPWLRNPSICGVPVEVEVPCPLIPSGPSTIMTAKFYARRNDDGCLTATDLQQMATYFSDAFNSLMQQERYPCEPQYLQVSNVVVDQSTLGGCRRRREMLRGSNIDEEESQRTSSDARRLRRDFDEISASMTVTANIWATNLAAILAGESLTVSAAAAGIITRSGGIYEVETGKATHSPSAMPSAFPSEFPSGFPSMFPSEFPTEAPPSDSHTGTNAQVEAWCESFAGTPDACCERDPDWLSEPACYWGGVATVFKGSCNGRSACNFGDPSSRSISVGPKSCNGSWACNLLGALKTTLISIDADSCNGMQACERLAWSSGKTIVIGTSSCTFDRACWYIGAVKATSVSIGDVSCLDDHSCGGIGRYAAKSIQILDSTCPAPYSCNIVGYFNAISIVIRDSACTIDWACDRVGDDNATSVDILENACTSAPQICRNQDGAGAVQCSGNSCTLV